MEQLIQQLQQTLQTLLRLPSWLQALLQPTIQNLQAQLANLLAGGSSGGGGPPPPGPGAIPTLTPELESVVLFGAGVLVLAGYVWRVRREQRLAARTGPRAGGRLG
jgi:hypothetical protein